MAEEPSAAVKDYRDQLSAEIQQCVERMGCQPILFIGSGLSKRYFGAPSWEELLAVLAKQCPLIDKGYPYYKQTFGAPMAVGEEFARLYQQWAWDKGKNQFPAELFKEDVPPQAYLKYTIAQHLQSITPKAMSDIKTDAMQAEIASLQGVKPHAVITTNHDQFLELAFPEYQPVIGQSIISSSQVLFGEIFKIHGCVSEPNGIVFTQKDYDDFLVKKKYLSAKLLTYFSEHPLLFVGYSASDPNIRAILSDIDEAIPRPGPAGAIIPNIYILEWRKDSQVGYVPAKEKLIEIDPGKSIRIKAIETDEFDWVFSAFGSQQPLNGVSPKVLRALLHRSYDLVRHDIPRKTVQADFQMLEQAVKTGPEFAKLFGISTVNKASSNAADYPYILSEVAERIAGKGTYWNVAQTCIERILAEKHVNIKASDNQYHSATKTGRGAKSVAHKYSDAFVTLCKAIRKEEDYELDL
jgi:hypothetical protein